MVLKIDGQQVEEVEGPIENLEKWILRKAREYQVLRLKDRRKSFCITPLGFKVYIDGRSVARDEVAALGKLPGSIDIHRPRTD
jgi:hypothetical protein